MKHTLNGEWKLYFRRQMKDNLTTIKELNEVGIDSIPAFIPSNVELDLSNVGLLPKDLFMGNNILQAQKYETYEWWYVKTFIPEKCNEGYKAVLHFGGVDCFADYYLNDKKIGSSHNMFIEKDFDVTDNLEYGKENTLLVHIKSPILHESEKELDLDGLIYSWHKTFVASGVRKAPHSYGWDIMPRAVSAGIWRDVFLEYKPVYDFKYIHFETINIEDSNAHVEMFYDSNLPQNKVFSNTRVKIEGNCGDAEFSYLSDYTLGRAGTVRFVINNAKLWWPKYYGEPNMYDIKVTLLDDNGNEIISKKLRQGFRKLQFHHTDTIRQGGGFNFIINDVKIFALGSNWVAMDVYHSRDKKRYAKALEMAEDIGCNILRCWGGNVYEDTEFFDFCDEHGIMVWQDFAMACKYYPQTEEFFDLIREEAESVVKKYRNHCCLVMWCGDNEIDELMVGKYDKFKEGLNLEIKPSFNKITREVIPSVLSRLDPLRPYLPSSPYIPDSLLRADRRDYCAEEHLWGPRDYYKSEYYNQSKAYFVSETGYHGCPSRESLEKFITPEKLWPYDVTNEEWNLHSSDQENQPNRILLMFNQIKNLFGLQPETLDEFVEASQISQSEAFKFFIERVRGKMDYMGGIIWWNLVDGWPQLSDAVVDYYYNKKRAYEFIKRSSRDFIIMIDESNGDSRSVLASNISLKRIKGKVKIIDLEKDKEIFQTDFIATPNGNTKIGTIPANYSEKGMYLIVWEIGGKEYFNTYLYGIPTFDFNFYKKWLRKAENYVK